VNAAQVMNLGQLLTQTARLFPDRPALFRGEQTWTWAQLEQRVAAMTVALRQLGVRKGDRILVQSRSNLQMFESCWIAFRMGCVWVPTIVGAVNTLLTRCFSTPEQLGIELFP
jgi:acyl-CoA synthetase (AMP-forming)/AMP-acid ligase II